MLQDTVWIDHIFEDRRVQSVLLCDNAWKRSCVHATTCPHLHTHDLLRFCRSHPQGSKEFFAAV